MSATELVRRLAVRGKRLACELDDRIYCSRTVAATTRSHSSNRPGSQGPGASDSALLVSLDLSRELGWALREAARASGVAGVPGELPQQFDYLFRQVPYLDGEWLLDPVGRVVSQLERYLNPVPEMWLAFQQSQQRLSGSEICERLADSGLDVTTNQLRLWASRGGVGVEKDPETHRNTYSLTEVLAYLENR